MKKFIKHILVPEHTKLSEKEKEKLLKEHNVSIKELPRIMKDDPAIKHLNVKVGDIIRIKRNSQTAGESIYYRVVVSSE